MVHTIGVCITTERRWDTRVWNLCRVGGLKIAHIRCIQLYECRIVLYMFSTILISNDAEGIGQIENIASTPTAT